MAEIAQLRERQNEDLKVLGAILDFGKVFIFRYHAQIFYFKLLGQLASYEGEIEASLSSLSYISVLQNHSNSFLTNGGNISILFHFSQK